MAVKKRKPTSPGRRFQTVSDFSEITTDTPEKSLIAKANKTGGRNTYGRDRASSWWWAQATLSGHRLPA